MNTLITIKTYCLTNSTEELLIELLCGVKMDPLGRMRVTIKVSVNRNCPQYASEIA